MKIRKRRKDGVVQTYNIKRNKPNKTIQKKTPKVDISQILYDFSKNKSVKIIQIRTPEILKKFEELLEKKRSKNLTIKKNKKISFIDPVWYTPIDIEHKYELIEHDKFLILIIWNEWWPEDIGNSRVSKKGEVYHVMIEPKKWVLEKTNMKHWEDGSNPIEYAPLSKNRIKYLLEDFPKPSFKYMKWGDQEYRDYGHRFDDKVYDKMWYKWDFSKKKKNNVY